MPGGHDTTIEVSNIMSVVFYIQILKQSVLKPASPGITLNCIYMLARNVRFYFQTASHLYYHNDDYPLYM